MPSFRDTEHGMTHNLSPQENLFYLARKTLWTATHLGLGRRRREGLLAAVPLIPRLSNLRELQSKASSYSVISFDLFDTLLFRQVHPPQHLERAATRRAQGILEAAGWAVPDLWERRLTTITRLRERASARGGDPEFSLEELYAAILALAPTAVSVTARELADLEFNLELRSLRRHEDALPVLSFLKDRGVTVVVTTDTHFERERIDRLLKEQGLARYVDHVFVSCEEGRSKSRGRVFERLFEKLEVSPSEVLHVGDNFVADFLSPRAKGVDAFWLRRPEEQRRHRSLIQTQKSVLPQFAEQSRPIWRQEEAAFQVGFRKIAPAIYSFLDRAYEDCLRRGVRDVYFLARDGYALHHIWNAIQDEEARYPESMTPRTHYLHLSRKVVFIPEERDLLGDETCLGRWLLKSSQLTLGSLKKMCGPEAPAFENYGLEETSPFKDIKSTRAFRKWAQDLARSDTFRAHTQARLALLRKYLMQSGLLGQPNTAIIDIGWNGTIPAVLSEKFASEWKESSILFFGRNHNSFKWRRTSLRFEPGYVYDSRRQGGSPRRPSGTINFIECCVGATHAPVSHFEENDGQVQPCFPEGTTQEDPALVRGVMTGGVALARWNAKRLISPERLRTEATRCLTRLLTWPTSKEANAVMATSFTENFHTSIPHNILLEDKKGWRTVRHWVHHEINDSSIWKAGALRRKGFPLWIYHFTRHLYAWLRSGPKPFFKRAP